nr:MAG TPA: protein of unknown function (DUF4501) [Caudoviricetes sp.]
MDSNTVSVLKDLLLVLLVLGLVYLDRSNKK